MDAKELKRKADAIIEAFAAGQTCEQILEADRTLTYHDIFHAVAEMPTSQWKRYGGGWFKKHLGETRMFRRGKLHRTD